jgi:hypothetical protein
MQAFDSGKINTFNIRLTFIPKRSTNLEVRQVLRPVDRLECT